LTGYGFKAEAYQVCHFSEGLNLFALQIGLDFGFAKNYPCSFSAGGSAVFREAFSMSKRFYHHRIESFVNLFCRRQRRIP